MVELCASLHDRLATIVGAANVLTAPSDTEPYLADWRGRFHGAANAIVRPGTTAEVAAIVSCCAAAGVPVVPQGGNTGLCGGAIPDSSGASVLVSLGRLNRVRSVDRENATITVEAGVPLAIVQQAAAAADLLFPLSLASEGSCTIGGNLSTNAGGTAVLRYGNTRDLALGLEVVLADGQIWNGLRGLRKDNTGYDLKHLFIGAEGTLGIVTAAVLKLFPAPRTAITALIAVATVKDAVTLLARMKSTCGDRLTGFELISEFALSLSRRHTGNQPAPLSSHPWYVLLQADDVVDRSPLAATLEASLAQLQEDGAILDAVIAQSGDQAGRLWALRENISEAQRREGPNIKHDISLPVSAIAGFLDESNAALLRAFPGARLVVFGHLGDGNLHYNLSAPEGQLAGDFMHQAEHANRIVHDLVAQHAGSFSAEHGVGQLKRDDLVRYKSAIEIDLMRAVKAALDPHGIMNPGKVL